MPSIKNIAIIAHVDHGKTTLVDKIMFHCELFRENENKGDLILDSNDLERERGITILSKNVSVNYKGVKINIIDTPGHADFGGEVERVINMADAVILLVDAFEGPMPQTRFVLQKAIQLGLKPMVCVNKVDKENCDPEAVYEKVFDLMFELEATEEQLDFPVVYGSAKNGWLSEDWQQPTDNIDVIFEKIVEYIPDPKVEQGTTQMQITSLDYSSFVGRIAIGRLFRGTLQLNQKVNLVKRDGSLVKSQIKELNTNDSLNEATFEEQAETVEEDISSVTVDAISLSGDSKEVEEVNEQVLEEQDDDLSKDKIESSIDIAAYYLQHAALSTESAANTAAREAFTDFSTAFSLPQFSQAKLWHVVFSGPYATRTEAMNVAKENGVTADVVIVRGEYVASRVPSEAEDDGR